MDAIPFEPWAIKVDRLQQHSKGSQLHTGELKYGFMQLRHHFVWENTEVKFGTTTVPGKLVLDPCCRLVGALHCILAAVHKVSRRRLCKFGTVTTYRQFGALDRTLD